MVHGWKFNLAVEDVHDGRRRQWLPWVALSWPRRRGGHVDEGKKESRACVCCLVWVNWGDSARQPHHIRRLISWWGLMTCSPRGLSPRRSGGDGMEASRNCRICRFALPRPMLPHCSTAARVSVSTVGMDGWTDHLCRIPGSVDRWRICCSVSKHRHRRWASSPSVLHPGMDSDSARRETKRRQEKHDQGPDHAPTIPEAMAGRHFDSDGSPSLVEDADDAWMRWPPRRPAPRWESVQSPSEKQNDFIMKFPKAAKIDGNRRGRCFGIPAPRNIHHLSRLSKGRGDERTGGPLRVASLGGASFVEVAEIEASRLEDALLHNPKEPLGLLPSTGDSTLGRHHVGRLPMTAVGFWHLSPRMMRDGEEEESKCQANPLA